MIRRLNILMVLIAVTLLSCSDEEGADKAMGELKLIVSMPSASTRAVGDPGSSAVEWSEWNKVALLLAYTKNGEGTAYTQVIKSEWSKEEFYKLPLLNDTDSPTDSTAARIISLRAVPGKAYVYGIAYYEDSNDEKSQELKNNISRCSNRDDIEALTVSNDYGTVDGTFLRNRFLSLATGFYRGMDATTPKTEGAPELLDITQVINDGYDGVMEAEDFKVITLNRLATKIDIQWEVNEGYQTNVRLTKFAFHGARTAKYQTGSTTDYASGSGRLFPTRYDGTEGDALNGDAIGGSKSFINTSEISQRNGRVYHYVFPDGTPSQPTMTLKITTADKPDGENYTLQFPDNHKTIQPATWYKVNATIVGNTGANPTVKLNVTQ